MTEKDMLEIDNYIFKKSLDIRRTPEYLSNDGEYVGGEAVWLTPEGKRFKVHFVARYDGTWSAYSLEEMYRTDYDDETRTRESFTYSTGNSAIAVAIGNKADFNWLTPNYPDYPKLLKEFRLDMKWDPKKAHQTL